MYNIHVRRHMYVCDISICTGSKSRTEERECVCAVHVCCVCCVKERENESLMNISL